MHHVNPLKSTGPCRSPNRGLGRLVAAFPVSLAVGAVLALSGSTRAQAPCMESFEGTSLSPVWNRLGSFGVTSAGAVSAPPDGIRQAVVVGGNGELLADLPGLQGAGSSLASVAAFLGVASSDLENLSPHVTQQGSALARTLTVAAGDVLSFGWDFVTLEAPGESQYRDYAVFTIASESPPAILLADTLTPGLMYLMLPSGQAAAHTGYHTYSHVFATAGTYTVGFAVFQVGDTMLDSGMLLDMVQVPGSSVDSDGDGFADCVDDCPNDPSKLAPGGCGCGIADVATTYYPDVDRDGYGDDALPQVGLTCFVPPGFLTNGGDCDDSNAAIHPGAGDPCNGIDDDCDGIVDPGFIGAYCTAGTTTHGCVATIRGVGMPSSSATSGFEIVVSEVEGQQYGVIFYGLQSVAIPWAVGGSSWRCVAQPLQRTSLRRSGGSIGGCDGVLRVDFNAWIQAHPGALGMPFAPGAVVYAQACFRDPSALRTSNLSNALSFTICE